VRIALVDLQGRQVATLVNETWRAGRHRVTWEGAVRRGALPSGLYFVVAEAPGFHATRRLVVTR